MWHDITALSGQEREGFVIAHIESQRNTFYISVWHEDNPISSAGSELDSLEALRNEDESQRNLLGILNNDVWGAVERGLDLE